MYFSNCVILSSIRNDVKCDICSINIVFLNINDKIFIPL